MKSSAKFRSLPGVSGFIGLVAVSATLAAPAAAQTTVFNNGIVNNISGTFPGSLFISNNTTVNFSAGSIGTDGLDSVAIADASIFNMSGGSTSGGRIGAGGSSVATLTGGTLGFDPFVGDSIVTFGNGFIDVVNTTATGKAASVGGLIRISGGSFSGANDGIGRVASTFSTGTMEIFGGSFDGFVSGQDSGSTTVHGGTFGVDRLGAPSLDISAFAFDNSQIEVLGGTFPGSLGVGGTGLLVVRGGSIGIDIFGCSIFGQTTGTVEVRGGSFTGIIAAFDNSVVNVFGCPLSLDGSGVLTGVLEDGTPISVNTFGPINLIGPCTGLTITATAFEPPMGKKKKIGSTLPIKFRLFFDGVEIVSEAQLNQTLADNGCTPGCPKLRIFMEDGVIGLPVDDVDENVGDPDEGDCFRYSAPNWIYNVRLLPPAFMPQSCFSVEIELGGCVLVPENNFFETK